MLVLGTSLGSNTCRRVLNHLTSMKTNEHQDPDGRAITVDLVGHRAPRQWRRAQLYFLICES